MCQLGIPDYHLLVPGKGTESEGDMAELSDFRAIPRGHQDSPPASEPHEPSSDLERFQGEVSSQSPSLICSYLRPFLTLLSVGGSLDSPSPYLLRAACGQQWGGWQGGQLRVGRDRDRQAELRWRKEPGAPEVGDQGEGRRWGRARCLRGLVMATGTGVGTSVCLHSDELVSEQPLERPWRSPMTQPAFSCRMKLCLSPSSCPPLLWLRLQQGTLLLVPSPLARAPVHTAPLRRLQPP